MDSGPRRQVPAARVAPHQDHGADGLQVHQPQRAQGSGDGDALNRRPPLQDLPLRRLDGDQLCGARLHRPSLSGKPRGAMLLRLARAKVVTMVTGFSLHWQLLVSRLYVRITVRG